MNFRQVGDPQRFVGKGIAKKCLFNQWKRGTVIRIVNMEGINTMFLGTKNYMCFLSVRSEENLSIRPDLIVLNT